MTQSNAREHLMVEIKALRDKAAHYRKLAALVTDATAKAALERMAQELSDEADELEQGDKLNEKSD
jgi:hypothetical protein